MRDLESVIRELETLGAWHTHHYAPFHYEAAETIHNAVVLLKEQIPVKPGEINGVLWFCGKCGQTFYGDYVYCPRCGRKVDWNEAN